MIGNDNTPYLPGHPRLRPLRHRKSIPQNESPWPVPPTRHADIWQMHVRPGPREGKGPLLITERRRVSQMNPTTILRSPIGDDIVGCWPEASVRCLAAIRPELGIKPTCQDGPTDAINPLRKPRPPHSITSSATASKFVGNSRPNDLAVFRLTTNRCDSGDVLRTLTRG